MTKHYDMTDVLRHLHETGEYPNTLNGLTVRTTTEQALRRRGWINDRYELTPSGQRQVQTQDTPLSENIDGPRPNRRIQLRWLNNDWNVTFDDGEADYGWWDRARRSQADGLGIAGSFLKPIASKKAAWVLGQQPGVKFPEAPDIESRVSEWVEEYHADIVLAMEESVTLADMFLVVNPDMSLTVLPPNVVYPIVNEKDYSEQIGWEVRQVFAHPEQPLKRQTIIDRFTPERRERTIKQGNEIISRQTWQNPLGMVPMVHIPNNLRAGERKGHPEAEALINVLLNYNETLINATEGVLKMGNPVGVFEKFPNEEAMQTFISEYGTVSSYTDADGQKQEVVDIHLSDLMALTGGEFNWKSPGSFTADTVAILELFFYLIVQHTEMPEFIFGNAIASSKASAEAQLPPFVRWVEKEQGRAAKWFKQLIKIVVAMLAVVEYGVESDTPFQLNWPVLTDADGQLTLESVRWAYGSGLLTREVALQQLGRFMDIDDPAAMLNQLDAEAEELRARDEEPFVPNATPADIATADSDDEPEPEPESELTQTVRQFLQEQQTGVMVAFDIDLDTATNLTLWTQQAGIESVPAEDMHLTLAYLGDMNDIDADTEAIEQALVAFAREQPSVSGAVGGTGRFNAGENTGGQDVLYASFDSPELGAFRQALVDALARVGAKVNSAHGFTPHITLAYIDPDDATPPLRLPTIPLVFDTIHLYRGGDIQSVSLTGDTPDDIESEDTHSSDETQQEIVPA